MLARDTYRMTDEEFAKFSRTHPNVKQSDISDIEEFFAQKMLVDTALRAQGTEIEFLKETALGAMGTDREIKFSDIESGMLRASLSDGRQALKEIMESIPVETPSCNDGTKMKDQGRKKKRNDSAGASRRS